MKKWLKMMPVLVLAALPGWAQLGGLSKPNVSGGGATPQEVDKFLKDAVLADALVQQASMLLLKAVGSKEDVAEIEAKMKAAKAIQDPKERDAKLREVAADETTLLQKVNFEKEREKLKAENNAKKNESIRRSLWNMALGGLKDTELVNSGKRMTSGPPSPEIAGKIPAVKEAIERLASQGEGVTKILGRAKSLMSTVGLENLPTSASEKPTIEDLS